MTIYVKKHERDCDGVREIRFSRYHSNRAAKKDWHKSLAVREGHISWHKVTRADYIAAMEYLKTNDDE